MKPKNFIYLGAILVILFGIIFMISKPSNITNIDSNTVKDLLNDEGVFVLQVHEPYMGELPNTDLVVSDWENIQEYVSQLPLNKDTPILVYCKSGRMSKIASEQLKEMGYPNIYNFENGMNEWVSDGNELVQRDVKEFDIEVGDWYFSPEEIHVNEGDIVRLDIDVIDGTHGFYLPEFGISKVLREGKNIQIEFIAHKKGQFSFFCNVPCGPGHRSMDGKIIID